MPLSTPIVEIFVSFQGEGTHVGERHLFVRFQDCEFTCKYCDTPLSFLDNRFCRVEFPPFSKRFRHLPNPIPGPQLSEILSEFDETILTVTGGEPLQKVPFLREWLPAARSRFKVLLETAGIHASELKEVLDWVDIISMDFKLPSSTGMHPWWREHEAFLKAAVGKEVYIKAVVTAETEEKDIRRAADLVASIDPNIPLVLQPVSPTQRFRALPTMEQVAQWQSILQGALKDVRVIPQLHKQLGIL